MTRFQYINTNFLRIKQEVNMGLISPYVLAHFAAYSRFDYYRKQGLTICNSVMCASEDMNISELTIFKIKKRMETEL